MSTTFEDRYRRKSFTGQAAPVSAPETGQPSSMEVLQAAAAPADEYKAYNSTAHPELELWIRTRSENEWSDVYLPYTYRNHMISDGNGFFISMHFSTPISCVVIHGRNLKELVHKLSKREIEWVMEYDPRDWAEVPEGAPCITGIEISHAPLPAKADDAEAETTRRLESAATH